jgi:hypothetical protein
MVAGPVRRALVRVAAMVLVCVLLVPSAVAAQYRFEEERGGSRWFKGNTHTHTSLTDGDSPPDVVAGWYKSHGYNFLVITDHDRVTAPATIAHLIDSTFVLVAGEEVTARFDTMPVHVNAIGLDTAIAPVTGTSVPATLQANVAAVVQVGAVAQVNHPNFFWALGEKELAHAEGASLFEVFNGHPLVNNMGGGGRPGTEEVWDGLLTQGRRIYGVASDDAHHFEEEFAPRRANPGRGWVVVRAPELTPQAIVDGLRRGDFYASTGVELEDVIVEPKRLEIRIRPGHRHFRYRTLFIGDGGRILAESEENPAIFTLSTPTTYVRAKVYGSDGSVAWVQPVFVRDAR